MPKPGVPESFKVLMKELQALCLDIQVLDENGSVVELKDDDEDAGYQPGRFRDDDYDRYQDMGSESEFVDAGYTMKETSDDDDLAAADYDEDTDADEDDLYGAED